VAVLTQRTSWQRAKKPRGFRLTDAEQRNIRVAMRTLHLRYGTWPAVAKALGVPHKTVKNAMCSNQYPGAAMGLSVARLAGVPFEDVIDGRFPKPGTCPLCGQPCRESLPYGRRSRAKAKAT